MYLKSDYTQTYIIKRSEFIVYLRRTKNEEEYKTFVSEIRKKHKDANHCCSAFYSQYISRSCDDKEPSNTAGIVILKAIINCKMLDLSVVVVRYFGGIKLGASGLVKAYRNCTSQTIALAPKVIKQELQTYMLNLDYEETNKITAFLSKQNIDFETIYDQKVLLTYYSNQDFKQQLSNLLRKDIEIIKGDIKVIEKDVAN